MIGSPNPARAMSADCCLPSLLLQLKKKWLLWMLKNLCGVQFQKIVNWNTRKGTLKCEKKVMIMLLIKSRQEKESYLIKDVFI